MFLRRSGDAVSVWEVEATSTLQTILLVSPQERSALVESLATSSPQKTASALLVGVLTRPDQAKLWTEFLIRFSIDDTLKTVLPPLLVQFDNLSDISQIQLVWLVGEILGRISSKTLEDFEGIVVGILRHISGNRNRPGFNALVVQSMLHWISHSSVYSGIEEFL